MGWIIFIVLFSAFLIWIAKKEKPKEKTGNSTPYPTNISTSPVAAYTPPPPTNFYRPSESSLQIIKGLIYLCKADGQMRDEEVMIIVNFLKRQQPEHKECGDWYLISKIREEKWFTENEYHAFINELSKDSLLNLKTWMQSIFGTQKKNHPYEDILFNQLQERIKSLA